MDVVEAMRRIAEEYVKAAIFLTQIPTYLYRLNTELRTNIYFDLTHVVIGDFRRDANYVTRAFIKANIIDVYKSLSRNEPAEVKVVEDFISSFPEFEYGFLPSREHNRERIYGFEDPRYSGVDCVTAPVAGYPRSLFRININYEKLVIYYAPGFDPVFEVRGYTYISVLPYAINRVAPKVLEILNEEFKMKYKLPVWYTETITT